MDVLGLEEPGVDGVEHDGINAGDVTAARMKIITHHVATTHSPVTELSAHWPAKNRPWRESTGSETTPVLPEKTRLAPFRLEPR